MPRALSETTPASVGPIFAANHSKIIELNDQLRTTFNGGRVRMPPSVYDLDDRLRGRALAVMTRYNKFDDSSEHDWGVFIFAGYSFEWRIEYRGTNGEGVSPDPSDASKTFRVLTLYALHDVLTPPKPPPLAANEHNGSTSLFIQ